MIQDRILVIPDTHFVMQNPSNRVNLIKEGYDILEWILESISKYNITRVIFLGDVFDRGYKEINHDIFSKYYWYIQKLNKKLDGNLNMVIGNHEITYSKDNPIYHWLEFGEKARKLTQNRERFVIKEPLITAPDLIEYKNIVIEFNHFDKTKTTYNKYIGDKELIGLYHDAIKNYTSSKSKIELDFNPVDVEELINRNSLIIGGHIHIPQNRGIYLNKLNTIVEVPGSMMVRSLNDTHSMVEVPMIEIYDDMIDNHYFKLEHIIYKLPDYDESFLDEVVEKNKEKYELQKNIQKAKEFSNIKMDIDSLIQSIPNNSRYKHIIKNSNSELHYEYEDRVNDILNIRL